MRRMEWKLLVLGILLGTFLLTTSTPLQALDVDFAARCQAPGVLKCLGFDSASDFVTVTWPDSGLYRNNNGSGEIRGTQDTNIKASGTSSLRFEIRGKTAADSAGYWRQAMGQNFGTGKTFYVQFRQRFSPEMLNINWYGLMGTFWKQVIIHNHTATCSDLALVTVNLYAQGIPTMYTNCGARGLSTNDGIPPFLLQQGDYNCAYRNVNAADCFLYPENQWVTFYYEVKVGTWGQANSSIKAWVALDGQPYKQWVNMPAFQLNNDTPGDDYDHVTLLPYMTAKDSSVDHPTAYTWYDELIISSQPIVAPGATPSVPTIPLAPTGLTVR